jgi:hypothetical protein
MCQSVKYQRVVCACESYVLRFAYSLRSVPALPVFLSFLTFVALLNFEGGTVGGPRRN